MTEKRKLDAHPSVLIAYSAEADKLLMSVYDEGYPRKAYRLSANLIGGNPEAGDSSPENVLIKEISEEFNPNHTAEKKFVGLVAWARQEDIRLIRSKLLAELEPFQDFFVVGGEIPGGNKPYMGVYSTFIARISGGVIELAERNIKDRKNLTTEGLVGVFSIGELAKHLKGEFSTAHATAPILNYRFGSSIPYPKALTAEPIGMPRRSFKDYTCDFEYNNENLIKASNAQD